MKQTTRAEMAIVEKTDGPAIRLAAEGDDEARDRFSVRVKGKDVVITGSNGRSVLFGVYHFLETFCGVRF